MKLIKRIRDNIRYKLEWLEVLSSPFVGLKSCWYFGNVEHGVPYFVPTKWFGFDIVPLGRKVKYGDFRHEWNPMLSLVLFKKQLAVWFLPDVKDGIDSIYWEAWLNYKYCTNENKSKEERVKELIANHSTTWVTYRGDKREIMNHYHNILKPKYKYLI